MNINRRRFLKKAIASSTLIPFAMTPVASAIAKSINNGGYKAIVFVNLVGGNDALSMLVPNKDEDLEPSFVGKGYNTYAEQRQSIKISNTDFDLDNYSLDDSISLDTNPYHVNGTCEAAFTKGVFSLDHKSIPFGVNSLMPELAHLINNEKVSILGNIGTLVEPVTKDEVKNGEKNYPPFIYSHNSQRQVIQTGIADDVYATGWAGRVADLWEDSYENNLIKLGVSYKGTPTLLSGKSAPYLTLKAGNPAILNGVDQAKSDVIDSLNGAGDNTGPIRRLIGETFINSKDNFNELLASWEDSKPQYASVDPYGNPLFSTYPKNKETQLDDDVSGELLEQLETVAHMMKISKVQYGVPAQIFYVELNGFDHHSNQAQRHPRLLRELSLALYSFEKALQELDLFNDVITVTTSDFGRTVVANSSGTDHAWGTHQLIMGGTIKGGALIGDVPSIIPNGVEDASWAGRIIPTMSYEQVFAPVVNWLGVQENEISQIFPNIENFKQDDDIKSAFADIWK